MPPGIRFSGIDLKGWTPEQYAEAVAKTPSQLTHDELVHLVEIRKSIVLEPGTPMQKVLTREAMLSYLTNADPIR